MHKAISRLAVSFSLCLLTAMAIAQTSPAPSESSAASAETTGGHRYSGSFSGLHEYEPPIPEEKVSLRSGVPIPETVDAAIGIAMSANPEILTAQAKLSEASADLREARLKVTQQVTAAYRDYLEKQRRLVNDVKGQEKARAANSSLDVPPEQLAMLENARQLSVYRLKREIEDAELALRALLGADSGISSGDGKDKAANNSQSPLVLQERPLTPSSEVLQKALAESASIDFDKAPLDTVTEFLSQYLGVNIVVDMAINPAEVPVTIHLANGSNSSLKQALLALADTSHGKVCFVMRDYGIYATTPEHAQTIPGATIPSTIPYYVPADSVSPSAAASPAGTQ